MLKAKIIQKMIDFYDGNQKDIAHFLKVWGYAKTIGELENVDDETLEIIEIAAIVHDIACPICRKKYGHTKGPFQEKESEALLKPFLEEFHLSLTMQQRVIYIVSHHHTYTHVDGIDYQIILEADYLVNADESHYSQEAIKAFGQNVFQTKSGIHLLNSIFLSHDIK